MDNKEYNDDVYLEPTVELSSADASALAERPAQDVNVIICVSGC
ncbi:MAG TPA: hypothetical protein VJR02_19310 [Pyrinomonadaceae bacterium]|nr:hypothetical protein [Pyrinomonadaceae bacterium]